MFKRIYNLFTGFIRLLIGGVERKNPAVAYENAIDSLTKKYVTLKQSASALVARRDSIDSRLAGEREQLRLTEGDLDVALEQNQDDVAVVLLQRKEVLKGEIAELEEEFTDSVKDSEEAKSSLNLIKMEVNRLKDEKDRVIAKLRSAEARIAVQEQLEGFSVDAELKALEGVRENVSHKIAESKLNKELQESSLDNKIAAIRERSSKERAVRELEDIKRSRKALPAHSVSDSVVDAEFDAVPVAAKSNNN